jgi:hypothetical protein
LPPAPYAIRADLYAWIGEEKAQQYFGAGKLSGNALGAAVDAALIESQALMDMAFERGDYAVPVDRTQGRNPEALAAVLKRYCRIGAVRTQLAGLQGVEEGMKEELATFAAFLEAIQMGTEDLPGLDRTGGEEERLTAGRLGFAEAGGRDDNLSQRTFAAFNHGLLGGGGMSGNPRDDGDFP